MKIKILHEAGYREAILGLSLSYGIEYDRAEEVAKTIYNKDGGHNKFLESIVVWLDITAPRFFWQEFDTYRVGITKQSESTMHTITKRPLIDEDFECHFSSEYDPLESINHLISAYKITKNPEYREFVLRGIKNLLPEGFLQRRIVCTNYKTLRNIILQRRNHRLEQWKYFVSKVLDTCEHPEYLGLDK